MGGASPAIAASLSGPGLSWASQGKVAQKNLAGAGWRKGGDTAVQSVQTHALPRKDSAMEIVFISLRACPCSPRSPEKYLSRAGDRPDGARMWGPGTKKGSES